MVLADSSVWADHLRQRDDVMIRLLDLGSILLHPMVIGKMAMSSLKDRASFLRWMSNLPLADVAGHEEVMGLVERERLFSSGMKFMDAHLLASALITPDARLWTRDRKLRDVAERLGVAIRPWGRD